jgi:hypothetical protein
MLAALRGGVPAHDPPLSAREEAVFLLHTASEIEHALLVQYLYAAFSLKRPDQIPASDPQQAQHQEALRRWRQVLLGIAQEEMGHLMTVQDLLLLVGGSPNFEREDMPFRSDFYPFPFALEPLTKESLAKYVLAEMPEDRVSEELLQELRERASLTTMGVPVNRVGALYASLYCLFTAADQASDGAGWLRCSDLQNPSEGPKYLADEDFLPAAAVAPYQGDETWHYEGEEGFPNVLVPTVGDRQQARSAIQAVAEQGEGGPSDMQSPSHFSRFRDLYQEFPETDPARGAIEWVATRAAPANPNTLRSPSPALAAGRITNKRSLRWAALFNLRYRMLLAYLPHFHLLNRSDEGQRARADFIQRQSVYRMMPDITRLADQLLDLPRGNDAGPARAAPPFELPDSLALPGREADRWRMHIHLRRQSLAEILQLEAAAPTTEQQLLDDLKRADTAAVEWMETFMRDEPPPQPGERLSYERDIFPLFRAKDISHMRRESSRPNLSRYEAVRDQQGLIRARLTDPDFPMPPAPDPRWPPERIALFERWAAEPNP